LEESFALNPEREVVLDWVLDEWIFYANAKFGPIPDRGEHDDHMAREGWMSDGFWIRQVFQYASRSDTFMAHGNGDEFLMLKGKQAAMKMATTLIDGLASMIRAFGNPPGPGPSGEITEWGRSGVTEAGTEATEHRP
jgi:hypothetical protein